MTVGTRTAPNNTTQSAAQYKANIDAAFGVDARFGGWFAPHEQDVGSPAPEMSVRLDAGYVFRQGSLSEVAAQTVSGFTTPASGYTRIDRVVIDARTGVASRVAGTAQTPGSPGPSAPAVPAGKLPVCQIAFTSASTTITNNMITDERVYEPALGGCDLLATASPSGAAAVDFTSFMSDAYSAYLVVAKGIIPATDNVELWMRLSDDNGATFKSGVSDYRHSRDGAVDGSAFAAGSGADAKIILAIGLGNDHYLTFSVLFHSGAVESPVLTQVAYRQATDTFVGMTGCGMYQAGSSAAFNAFRFLMSSGNFSGNLYLFGMRSA